MHSVRAAVQSDEENGSTFPNVHLSLTLWTPAEPGQREFAIWVPVLCAPLSVLHRQGAHAAFGRGRTCPYFVALPLRRSTQKRGSARKRQGHRSKTHGTQPVQEENVQIRKREEDAWTSEGNFAFLTTELPANSASVALEK